ncbi:MAG: ankyrin repeat domain-containing protein, partial [Saprospiraceae bacterium]|nr:ankyrin repeat domain-containing protein [Saprospiraceae bacterium]
LNKVHLVALFIKNGADTSIPNHDGSIPLALAVQENKESIVGILLHGSKNAEKDANWKNHLGEPLLVLAAENGQVNAVRVLVKYGAYPDATDYMDNTALTMAARNGNPTIISYLVENGANLNHQNMLGITPITIAAESGHFAAANYLAAQGADVNTRSFAGIAATDFYGFTSYNPTTDKP